MGARKPPILLSLAPDEQFPAASATSAARVASAGGAARLGSQRRSIQRECERGPQFASRSQDILRLVCLFALGTFWLVGPKCESIRLERRAGSRRAD